MTHHTQHAHKQAHAHEAPATGAEHPAATEAATATAHPHHATKPEAEFEARTYQMARGSETPDGPVEALALHHDHGMEGKESKAAHQVEEVVSQHQHPHGPHEHQHTRT